MCACAFVYLCAIVSVGCMRVCMCLSLCRRDAAKNCMYSYVAPPALATLYVSFNLLGVILIYQVYEQTGCVCALVHMHMCVCTRVCVCVCADEMQLKIVCTATLHLLPLQPFMCHLIC